MEKITNEAVSAWLENRISPTFPLPIGSLVFEIKQILTEDEIYTFVSHVVESSFTKDGNYSAVKRDVVFKVTALQMLTNCAIPTKEDGKHADVDKCLIIVDVMGLLDEEVMDKVSPQFARLIVDLDDLVSAQLSYEKDKRLTEPLEMTDIAMMRIATLCDQVYGFIQNMASNSERGMDIMTKMVDTGLTPEQISQAALDVVKKSQSKGQRGRKKKHLEAVPEVENGNV